jgi:hypothetical protein
VLTEGGDLRSAGAPDEGEGEIAAGGHDLGGGAAAQVGAILAEGHVAQPVAALNGMITNDKFCMTRACVLPLSWWRCPKSRRQ